MCTQYAWTLTLQLIVSSILATVIIFTFRLSCPLCSRRPAGSALLATLMQGIRSQIMRTGRQIDTGVEVSGRVDVLVTGESA